MYKLIFLFACLPLCNSFSQKIEFQVLDKKNKTPLGDVLFYCNDNVIAKSNKNGIVKFDQNKYDSLVIVKEDYYDTILNISKFISNTLYLRKIDFIQLKEVVVYKKNIETILDSVYSNVTKLSNINSAKYLHFFNVLTTAKDTLLFVNNRIHFERGKGCFIDTDNAIIANFTTKNNKTVFSLNNRSIVFNNNFIHSNNAVNSFELLLVTKLKNKFLFSIFEEEDYYQIKFEPKKKNTEYPYSGYLIVDKDDFGVYEFWAEIRQMNNRRNLVFNDQIINFQTLSETSYIKYNKNEAGSYDLVNYAFDCKLKVLNGDFKDKIFINTCRKEVTPPFDGSKSVSFDVITYKVNQ